MAGEQTFRLYAARTARPARGTRYDYNIKCGTPPGQAKYPDAVSLPRDMNSIWR
jgi:hypothetical protein